jgi:cell division protein FtsW
MEYPLVIVAGVAAIAVRLFGQQVNGAYRWIQVGGISLQAAELIKLALLIWLAGFLSDRLRAGSLIDAKKTLGPLLIAVGAIGVVVLGIQTDFGSSVVMIAMIAAMVFVAGMPLKKILTIGAIIITIGVIGISALPYRRQRLLTFLHPTSDCLSTGYQACQALIAVGSGGVIGLGLGRSVQAYGYLPESANDSIFAIYGEKFGFIGSVVLLGIFVAFFMRLKGIIDRAPNDFARLIGVGVLAWFSMQTLINIGAMIGLLPLKGITLPFISYGGTSVVFVMLATGLVFHISRYTTYIRPAQESARGTRRVGA